MAIAALLSLLPACTGEEPPVLTVVGISYTESELLGLTPSRQEMLAQLTAFAVSLSRQEGDELFEPAIEIEAANQLYRRAVAERMLADARIGDAELERRYRAQPEWELTIRHLIVLSGRYETAATRDAARAKAARALERIRAGEAFPEVAADVSEEPGAEGRQGLLNPGREDAWVDEFWEAGVALEVGGISDVVETQYGFHVLRLEAREEIPFAEARSVVALRVAQGLGLDIQSTAQAPRPADVQFSPDLHSAADPATVVAEWEGGSITLGQVIARAAATGGREWDLVREGDAATRGEMLDLELARANAVDIARSLGVESSPEDRAESIREWTTRFEQTGQLLGIPPGLPMSGVKEAAVQALGRSGQNADLSRSAVRNWRGLLNLRHHFDDPAASETASGGTP